MIKGVFRMSAFVLLAASFVAAVMDGARSLANSTLDYARLGATAFRLFGDGYLALQPAIERYVHPFLWDPVLVNLLLLPTSLVLLVTGLVCHRIGQRSASSIGYLAPN